MPRSILLRHVQRSLASAAEQETDFLLAVKHQHAAEALRRQLWLQRPSIEAVVRHHLGLASDDGCTLLPQDSWLQGGFNLCLLVAVSEGACQRVVVFRCPMAHKLAEDVYAGTIDEKLRSEVATYVWMQEHCANIRIPALYAFGLKDGSHFVHVGQRPLYARICRSFWRWIYRVLNNPLLSNYSRDASVPAVDTPYMLLEYIGADTGQELSLTWAQHLHDADRRNRLFRGISRIMLSLARLPQPRIGSFLFNTSDGTISLSNRPIICTMMIFENGGTPRAMEPGQTYQSTDSFSNIFVDDNWEVTALIDMEWMCTLPVEMLSVPYWLTNCSIDDITDDNYGVFEETRRTFLAIMDEESKSIPMEHGLELTRTMRRGWDSKGVWFWSCLKSVNAWLFLFEDHIAPRFSAERGFITELKKVSMFWRDEVDQVVKTKVDEEEQFQAELRELFDKEGRENE
ncbi:aminoglycoside phosphotransferase [Hirsutella rhossiliensis]|uniref:Aminoglycoside phosphotransferase n=1 Tax=Hirsutella rhossiliensis TaxID=111463 RepID=A0A9P8N5Y4_9HYPO|nr:Aminoglycoside phosphotransferase [Hirsutella rhossiliensis]KAH0967374.1 Aminoglycoside phosphotransferase [Hirsutella rhossiliensis]